MRVEKKRKIIFTICMEEKEENFVNTDEQKSRGREICGEYFPTSHSLNVWEFS